MSIAEDAKDTEFTGEKGYLLGARGDVTSSRY